MAGGFNRSCSIAIGRAVSISESAEAETKGAQGRIQGPRTFRCHGRRRCQSNDNSFASNLVRPIPSFDYAAKRSYASTVLNGNFRRSDIRIRPAQGGLWGRFTRMRAGTDYHRLHYFLF
jgi:hypothetical protein